MTLAGTGAGSWLSGVRSAFICATTPLCVSLLTGPKTADDENALMTSILLFFRLTGRHMGIRLVVAGGNMACSSERMRQPRSPRAAHSVLLPAPGMPGMMIPALLLATTAACSLRYSLACSETLQFMPHSRKA